ncbi:uncharacterized protein LOC135372659 [Ornithodoros turicata]|uniref:uncharacterized protein LOC135372659 n=1 Tax=Ornithodoros turicata TaxID=34597 RepID=UPI00313A0039
MTWAESIAGVMASTDAELLVINKALDALKHHNIENAVILSDTKGALQRIACKYGTCPFANKSRVKIEALLQNNTRVALQWLPSHVGIPGNEHADQLCKDATRKPPIFKLPTTQWQIYKTIKAYIWNQHPDQPTATGTAPPPCLTTGLSRQEAKVLLKLRTSTAKTRAREYRFGPDPPYPTVPPCPTSWSDARQCRQLVKYSFEASALQASRMSQSPT